MRHDEGTAVSAAPDDMSSSPAAQRFEDRPQGPSVARHAVPHTTRGGCERALDHQSVRLHLPQLFTEDFGRHLRHRASQLAKAVGTRGEALEEHRLPPTRNDADSCVQGAGRPLATAFSHIRQPPAGGALQSALLLPLERHGSVRSMSTLRLYRVIMPVDDVESATQFYSTLLEQPGMRVSPGRH